MDKNKLRRLISAAVFSALIFLGTYLIKIPIPNGYIHFGDGFIYSAAAVMPLPYALAAAAIGGALADLLAGFAIYAPCTAIIKALMALAVGIIMKNNAFVARLSGDGEKRGGFVPLLIAAAAGGAINMGGYFLADVILFGLPAATAALPMNGVQSSAGIMVFLMSLPVIAGTAKGLK